MSRKMIFIWEKSSLKLTKTIGGGLLCWLNGSTNPTVRLDWWVGGVIDRCLLVNGGDGERRVNFCGSWCCKFIITLFITFNG
jgi:hypothetical protein